MIRKDEIPDFLPDSDKELIEKALEQRWEDIDESKGSFRITRRILHDIATTKHHLAEFKAGME
ncbi:MAG: hypothetical protein J6U51_06915 [Bacteroidales bacterium]|nr:hypothetical protein [Bacteroidales bacterium]